MSATLDRGLQHLIAADSQALLAKRESWKRMFTALRTSLSALN